MNKEIGTNTEEQSINTSNLETQPIQKETETDTNKEETECKSEFHLTASKNKKSEV